MPQGSNKLITGLIKKVTQPIGTNLKFFGFSLQKRKSFVSRAKGLVAQVGAATNDKITN